MTGAPDKGQLAGHTRADPAAPAPAPELGGADPETLLAGLPDLDGGDLFAMAAELEHIERRARGRPAGSGNRKNNDMIALLAAKGHRDPWVTLSLIQSADTALLAAMLGAPVFDRKGKPIMDGKGGVLMAPADRLKVAQLQKAAAEAIMPYHHGKKPQQVELDLRGSQRPLLVVGELNVSIEDGASFMTAGVLPAEKPNEINGEVVRDADVSHDG